LSRQKYGRSKAQIKGVEGKTPSSTGVKYKSIDKVTDLPISNSPICREPLNSAAAESNRQRIDFSDSDDEDVDVRGGRRPPWWESREQQDSRLERARRGILTNELEAYATSPAAEPHFSPPLFNMSEPRKVKMPNTTIYKVQMFRFVEIATKRILFHLAKSSARYKALFVVSSIERK